ncbi:type III secretion system chaperone family protein [Microlunatus soli]|uniref:DUF3137 domain-containing protein n=1 Tax=Microlunatus soli TaxID=630515 RepID=A0A1H1U4B8_9ACTN|nr:hypothetical protein [Microlunatus soli]SDS67096.1 hypothetical protein SAMN04489812_2628 [Microlunatus soli]
MEQIGIAVFVVVFVAVIGLWFAARYVKQRRQEQRQQAVQQFAAGRGWQFIGEDESYASRWTGKPFTGWGGTARNIVVGQHRGRNVCSFEYHYSTVSTSGGTTRRHNHDFSIFVVQLPAPVPAFSVEGEGIFGGKVAEALGFERVDSGDPDFDNDFKVKSDDARFGALVLQQPLLQMLKATGPWDWRFTGPDMLSYENGFLKPELVQPRLDLMCDVLDRIPSDVWQHR